MEPKEQFVSFLEHGLPINFPRIKRLQSDSPRLLLEHPSPVKAFQPEEKRRPPSLVKTPGRMDDRLQGAPFLEQSPSVPAQVARRRDPRGRGTIVLSRGPLYCLV